MKYGKILISLLTTVAFGASAEAPEGYYSSCEGKYGKQLIEKLCDVVGPHSTVSYDGLWTVYSDTDLDANGKLWDMYSTKRWDYPGSKCGSYSKEGDCYNREHSFPKSWFNNSSPMVSDAFHVYPTDGKVNGMRSNFPYGETNGEKWKASGVGLGKLGACTFPGYSGTVFEPDDEYKGDFARTYFYMVTAYNSRITAWDSDMLDGTSYPAFASWSRDLLLKWHRQDPVSQKEIDRNEAVYKHQNNRNPFIDHPELAEHIWGNAKTQAWYVGGVPTPTLAMPVDGSTVDFGLSAVNYQISRYIQVKGTNFDSPITLSVNNSSFRLSATSLTAAAVNAGTGFSVSFRGTTKDEYLAVVTLTSGGQPIARVNLRAVTTDGIPASTIYVTEDSFTAGWVDLADQDNYTLSVSRDGLPLAGYPRSVQAALEEYTVTGLDPETTYTWQLSSDYYKSEVITVTTNPLTPMIQYAGETDFEFFAEPGIHSDYQEVWLDTENIVEDMQISVTEPFEISTSPAGDWKQAISLTADADRFYVRIGATEAGVYESFIVINYHGYINDEGRLQASVRDLSAPWFVEDFENADKQKVNIASYNMGTFEGKAVTWTVNDAGIWVADPDKNGEYSLRLGKSSQSCLTTSTPKPTGIGTVSFALARWTSADGDVTLAVEYSADGDEWTQAGTVTTSGDGLKDYSVVVNVSGENYLRLRQTAGKRGNLDDIVVTDYYSSVTSIIDPLNFWDAYCADGSLVVTSKDASIDFLIFDLAGIIIYEGKVQGTLSIPLAAGLYIVSDGNGSRRVVIK